VLTRLKRPSGTDRAEAALDGERALWWQHEGNRAIRLGNWKLVAAGPEADWELYDLSIDRTEQNDLASSRPEDVQRMARQWEAMRDQFAEDAKQVNEPK
jgi:arylsulfatase A-like enzyme